MTDPHLCDKKRKQKIKFPWMGRFRKQKGSNRWLLSRTKWLFSKPTGNPLATATGVPATAYLPAAETLTFGPEAFSAARFFRRLQQRDSGIPSHTGEKHANTRFKRQGSIFLNATSVSYNAERRGTFLTFHRSLVDRITARMEGQ